MTSNYSIRESFERALKIFDNSLKSILEAKNAQEEFEIKFIYQTFLDDFNVSNIISGDKSSIIQANFSNYSEFILKDLREKFLLIQELDKDINNGNYANIENINKMDIKLEENYKTCYLYGALQAMFYSISYICDKMEKTSFNKYIINELDNEESKILFLIFENSFLDITSNIKHILEKFKEYNLCIINDVEEKAYITPEGRDLVLMYRSILYCKAREPSKPKNNIIDFSNNILGNPLDMNYDWINYGGY